jgi:putative oxidoreductase
MIRTKKEIKTMSNILDLVGRVFISLIFLLSGINKIGNYEGTVGWMESLGMPGIFLIPAIILEIGAPILIMIGYKVKISAALLSIFCIATAVIFHNDLSNQMQFISFMKNIALAGGFLFLVVNETKDFSLDKKLNKH